jgi:hypothetical protein
MRTVKRLLTITSDAFLVLFIAYTVHALATNPTHNFKPRPFDSNGGLK